jgi:hypothetical protein
MMSHYRKNNHILTIDGETKLITEWSAESGVSYQLIIDRLNRDWPPFKAVYTIPRTYKNREKTPKQTT